MRCESCEYSIAQSPSEAVKVALINEGNLSAATLDYLASDPNPIVQAAATASPTRPAAPSQTTTS